MGVVPAAEVVVVGSANLDQVFRVTAIPRPGETVLSTGFATAAGGKGQNQAVAAARAGASTALIAALGRDAFGDGILAGLEADGIDSALVRRVDAPTGTAVIAVDDGGENTIVVQAGANALLLDLGDDDDAAIRAASHLVMQLEIPLETVLHAATVAHDNSTVVVLNAAPVRDLPDELLAVVDVLVVNEHEAAMLAPAGDVAALAPVVIVTLGAAGAVLYRAGAEEARVPAPRVEAVDATGAGDSFCGALAAALAAGDSLAASLTFAVTAASLSVQRPGAVPSIPFRVEIDAHRPR